VGIGKHYKNERIENMKVTQQAIDILTGIYNLNITNPCQNERYLHHYFTKRVQEEYPIDYENISNSSLHPEWATVGEYYKNDKKYHPIEKGTCGHIDFALGKYDNPDLGIEFKYCESWKFESIVFDFMKLLDVKNQIKTAISFSIICRRENELSNKLTGKKINETITEVTKRLGKRLDTNRPFLFWIIEIAPNSNIKQKQSWVCNHLNRKFESGIPITIESLKIDN